MKRMPPAAKNLFEKRFLDFQKLLIHLFLTPGVQTPKKWHEVPSTPGGAPSK